MNAELQEGARDGGSVADLISFGATIFPRGRDGGRRRDGGRGRAVGTTFPDDTKLITVHDPSSRAPWYVVGRPVRRQANLVLRFLLEPCALAALFVFEPWVGRHTGEVPRAARGPVRPCRSGAARPLCPGGVEAAQGAVDEEHRQAVHRGPRQKLGARATPAGQDPGLDEPVQRDAQQLEMGQAATPGPGRAGRAPQVIGCRECRSERPRLGPGETQVTRADRPQAPRRRGPVRAAARPARPPSLRPAPTGRPSRSRPGGRACRRNAGTQYLAPRPPAGSPRAAPPPPAPRSGQLGASL